MISENKCLWFSIFLVNVLTAIQLEKLSHELPCISAFEEEEEVLILSRTGFIVAKVENNSSLTILYLEHLNLDKETDDFFTYKMDALFG